MTTRQQTNTSATIIPGTPRNLGGYGMVNSVWLQWSAPIVLGDDFVFGIMFLSYSVQYSSDSGSTWLDYPNFINTIGVTAGGAGIVDGLDPSKTYCFRVRAFNSLGAGEYSSNFCVKPKVGPDMPPNVKAGYYYTYRPDGISLLASAFADWDAPSSDMPILDYVVEMKEGDYNWADSPNILWPGGVEPNVPSATVSTTHVWDLNWRFNVPPDQRLVRVKANTGGGYGPWSSPVALEDASGMSPWSRSWDKLSGNLNLWWDHPSNTKGYTLQDYVIKFHGTNQSFTAPASSTSISLSGQAGFIGSVTLTPRYLNGPLVAGFGWSVT